MARNSKEKSVLRAGQGGYTLLEMLTVILVIVLVAAIAIPAAIAIRDNLAFQNVNNCAKTIFLAAQTNLTERRADGHLTALTLAADGAAAVPIANNAAFPGEHWSTEYMYCTTGSPAFDRVLPRGAVEDALRDHQILIEYNPHTGNVFGVFYSEQDEPLHYGNVTRDEEQRRQLRLGYYCGSGLSSSIMEISESKVQISFVNGQEGVLEVRVPIPEVYYDAPVEFARLLHTQVVLSGESINRPFYDTQGTATAVRDTSIPTGSLPAILLSDYTIESGRYVLFRHTLDSLLAGESFGSLALSGAVENRNLSSVQSEESFSILPGQNIAVHATAEFNVPGSPNYDPSNIDVVTISPDSEYGINPMFDYLMESPAQPGRYVLAVSNGRNLQNLNALAPAVAEKVETVLILEDVDWNETVSHYAARVGEGTSDVPLCDLPYFVPIHNAELFGTATFIYPQAKVEDYSSLLQAILAALRGETGGRVPTLTDELDTQIDPLTSWRNASGVLQGVSIAENHASILGADGGKKISNIRINTAKYEDAETSSSYYAGAVDFTFTGLFSYVNTTVSDLRLVNPIVSGVPFSDEDGLNNPATGALIGAAGYDTLLTGCGVYVDSDDPAFSPAAMRQADYSSAAEQSWYGVSGEGAVGGLVGYAKSHRTVSGNLTADTAHLAFSNCFAAVNVSGNMRGAESDECTACDFGYSNGVGGFIGNSELTNFYNCYASGNVRANGVYVEETSMGSLLEWVQTFLGASTDLKFNGRRSMGAGGFVGTSHGTRYTNCFSTGNVDSVNPHSDHGSDSFLRFVFVNGWPTLQWGTDRYDYRLNGSGGFVGFMSYDETKLYGNDSGDVRIDQYTVFTDCYSVGRVSNGPNRGEDARSLENFSGANGRVRLSFSKSTNFVGDYYELYAPLAYRGTVPRYEDYYIFRHSYYLSNYYLDAAGASTENSDMCASGVGYEILADLTAKHQDNDGWVTERINAIKALPTGNRQTYAVYFQNNSMTQTYKNLYNEGFVSNRWCRASARDTHCYDLENRGRAYPFTMIKGLPYYGSWPESTASLGLTYYETYQDDRTAYYPLNDTAVSVDENSVVKSDGYAVFIANESAQAAAQNPSVRVSIGAVSQTVMLTETVAAPADSYAHSFNVYVLPRQLMTQPLADGEYYQKVTVSAGGTTYVCYFNPNAAMTQMNPMDFERTTVNGVTVVATEKPEKPTTVLIRSARQFSRLSELASRLPAGVQFVQQLAVDREAYSAETLPATVAPVTITGAYQGGGYVSTARISGFAPSGAGLFGTVSGTLANLDVRYGAASVRGEETAAFVVGTNRGTLRNVSLTLASATVTAEDSCGLLVGHNDMGTLSEVRVQVGEATLHAPSVGLVCGSTKGEASVAQGVRVSATRLNAPEATSAGGIFGVSEGVGARDASVSLGTLSAPRAVAGGVAGELSSARLTDVTVNITSASADVVGGVCARSFDVSADDVDVVVGTATGRAAYGGFGEISVCAITSVNVRVGTLSGREAAAGLGDFARANNLAATQDVSIHIADSVRSTEGTAAGFAVNLKGSAIRCHVYLSDDATSAGISAVQAAGFAMHNSADVTGCVVSGCGTVRGTQEAAGFIGRTTGGSVSSCVVTPVYAHRATSYGGSTNALLTVQAPKAAGFIGLNGASVSTSCALGTVSGARSAGFVLENRGSVERCFANTASASSCFILDNHFTVRNCYAWYSAGAADTLGSEERGAYYGCFFAPLAAQGQANSAVVLYAGRGISGADGRTPVAQMKLHSVSAALLNGTMSNTWKDGGTVAYPFNRELSSEKYPYPVFATHYGDWTPMPRYAYGLVYYEEVENGASSVINLQLFDLSATADKPNMYGKSIGFDNISAGDEKTILRAGYAVFCSNTGQLQCDDAVIGRALAEDKLNLTGLSALSAAEFLADYDLYELSGTGGQPIYVYGADQGVYASFVPAYARTFNDTDGTYEIRTPEQFSAIALNPNHSYAQTHDIDLVGTAHSIDSVRNYSGGGHTLTTDANLFASVRGTVSNLTVVAEEVVGNLFGSISSGAKLSRVTAQVRGATFGGTDGVLSSVNAGTIEHCSVAGITGATQISATGLRAASVGGLVGINSGTISDSSAAVLLSIEGRTVGCNVGGLVGQMNGGVLRRCSATGRIERAGTVSDAVIGGAVGRDGTAGATYTSISSAVTVDSDWYGMPTVSTDTAIPNAIKTPSGAGPVGAFLGYLYNGSLTDCSGGDPDAKYQFVGELYAQRKAHASSPVYAGPLDVAALQNPYTYDATLPGYAGFARHTDAFYSYLVSDSSLVRCTFTRPSGTYTQRILASERYYTMRETVKEEQRELQNAAFKLTLGSVNYSAVYYAPAGTYFYVTDGRCYPVTCQWSQSFFWSTYTLSYQAGSRSVTIGSGQANKTAELYTLSLEKGQPLVLTSGTSALSVERPIFSSSYRLTMSRLNSASVTNAQLWEYTEQGGLKNMQTGTHLCFSSRNGIYLGTQQAWEMTPSIANGATVTDGYVEGSLTLSYTEESRYGDETYYLALSSGSVTYTQNASSAAKFGVRRIKSTPSSRTAVFTANGEVSQVCTAVGTSGATLAETQQNVSLSPMVFLGVSMPALIRRKEQA